MEEFTVIKKFEEESLIEKFAVSFDEKFLVVGY